jgi:hypothetical protein
MQETSVEVRLRKKGPNGIPYAEIAVPDNFSLEKLAGIQKTVVRDLGRLVGLKACPACRSGMDLDIPTQVRARDPIRRGGKSHPLRRHPL